MDRPSGGYEEQKFTNQPKYSQAEASAALLFVYNLIGARNLEEDRYTE